MIEKITSSANKTIKLFRGVSSAKTRARNGVYAAEGIRMAEEAVRYKSHDIRAVIMSDSFFTANKNFANGLDKNGFSVYTVGNDIFAEASATVTPQGIAVLLNIPREGVPNYDDAERILILDGVSDPGNIGTMIRTAEAAGVKLVCMTKGCADIYNPKAVRSTMGSIFRMGFAYADNYDIIDMLRSRGYIIAASALRGSISPDEYDPGIHKKTALVIGSEAHGVSDEILMRSDVKIRIPMRGSVESLNAAVAAGILMYEIFK